MQIYSAIFSIREELTEEMLIKLVIEWNQGSPHNKIRNLDWDGVSRSIKFEDGNLSLSIQELRAYNIIAIRFHQLDDNNVIWTTDIVVDFVNRIFSIKLDRETTEETKAFVPKFKPPVIVNMLLEQGFVGNDGELEVSSTPIIINHNNYEMIQNVICRERDYKMPVVYVTKSWGKYPVNVNELAYRLRGLAHVLIEENPEISKILRDTCDGKNSHHGSIGIYYPSVSAGAKIITMRKYDSREDVLMNEIIKRVCHYVNQQARNRMLTWEGVQNELLRLRYASAKEKRNQAESEVDAVYDNFGAELEEKEKNIEELNNRIMALQLECQGLRAKIDNLEEVPLLLYGTEEELYEGEIRDQILEMLEEHRTRVVSNSRKEHLLIDILEHNEGTNELPTRREKIKKILKGYTKVGGAIKRELREFGFEITKDGGHYKLAYKGDSRYLFTMAASGSDSQHGGGNLSSEIIKKIL